MSNENARKLAELAHSLDPNGDTRFFIVVVEKSGDASVVSDVGREAALQLISEVGLQLMSAPDGAFEPVGPGYTDLGTVN